jgi:alpha/beta superfamily hydrolase
VLAAIDRAASLVPGRPVLACGYSFGADVTLACDDARVGAWLVAAPPLRMFDDFPAARDPRPKHLFVAAHDQFTPPDAARAATVGWSATTVHVVDMADHFFRGALDDLTEQLTATLATLDLDLDLP